jgi:ribonuclease-3
MLGINNPYRVLEKRIGYKFRDRSLLERALTHRSYRFEHRDVSSDNQRLEFLGDAVLGLEVAAYLFRAHSNKPEGDLTSLRSRVTSGKALARIARELGVGEFLRMGRGEERSGGRERSSTLEDALEAIVGAAWLDGGKRATDKIFRKVFEVQIKELGGDVWADNPKGHLQELSQARWHESPLYQVVSQEGPPHAAVFTVEVLLPDGQIACGRASSKQKAEVAAAREILAKGEIKG